MPASVRPEPGSDAAVGADVGAHGGVPTVASEAPPPQRRWGRWVLFSVAGLLVVALGYYLVTLYQVWSTGNADEARPADAIVVLGAAQYDGTPSPLLATRLDHALELYRRGLADTIVVTGGKQPRDRFTEAAASARYLEEHGVPAGAILQETTGRSSWQSLSSAATLLKQRDKTDVLLVSDPAHSMRIKGMADELGLSAHTSPTDVGTPFGRLVKEAAGVSLGRLIGYDRVEELTG